METIKGAQSKDYFRNKLAQERGCDSYKDLIAKCSANPHLISHFDLKVTFMYLSQFEHIAISLQQENEILKGVYGAAKELEEQRNRFRDENIQLKEELSKIKSRTSR